MDPDSGGLNPDSGGLDPDSGGFDPDSIGLDPDSEGLDPDPQLNLWFVAPFQNLLNQVRLIRPVFAVHQTLLYQSRILYLNHSVLGREGPGQGTR